MTFSAAWATVGNPRRTRICTVVLHGSASTWTVSGARSLRTGRSPWYQEAVSLPKGTLRSGMTRDPRSVGSDQSGATRPGTSKVTSGDRLIVASHNVLSTSSALWLTTTTPDMGDDRYAREWALHRAAETSDLPPDEP